jgi:hypothetical protein
MHASAIAEVHDAEKIVDECLRLLDYFRSALSWDEGTAVVVACYFFPRRPPSTLPRFEG